MEMIKLIKLMNKLIINKEMNKKHINQVLYLILMKIIIMKLYKILNYIKMNKMN